MTSAKAAGKQLYEIRQYRLDGGGDAEAVDEFLSSALLPALKRAGAGPVGLLGPATGEETKDRFVVITYQEPGDLPLVAAALDQDAAYQSALAEFDAGGPRQPPFGRISSELLLAMDCMPTAKLPAGIGTTETRVYELRMYESANESLGDRKVEMFNSGEVPIFLDCGIEPVFLGQALVSEHTPSLTYLTAYPNDEQRRAAWDAFRAHPDWKVLSGKERYQGTVSRIEKYVLRPLAGSEM
jgi:hypothetical protein